MEHDSSNFLPSQKILVQWKKIDGIHLFTLCLHSQEGKMSDAKMWRSFQERVAFFFTVCEISH